MNKKTIFSFTLVLEILVWLFYVAMCKYSYLVEYSGLRGTRHSVFPFPLVGLFAICITLPIVPLYRWIWPRMLRKRKYHWILPITIVYFIFVSPNIQRILAWCFDQMSTGAAVNSYFSKGYNGFFLDWNLIMTDCIAFLCIAFSRFSSENEALRHQAETDNLRLQLSMLKAQLQPHFLFNTLNSLYGMSLTGSKDTPGFILLFSQMMQYILYDASREQVPISEEISFLEGYFEIEAKKFPDAQIHFQVNRQSRLLHMPPLLLLPLIENAFKHGAYRLENGAGVKAKLSVSDTLLNFHIENEMLPESSSAKGPGGIGLNNIKKRLELYYPSRFDLAMRKDENMYIANLNIRLS